MGIENSVAVPNTGTAPIRVVQFTTLVNGVPTTVDAQVVVVSDSSGNVIDPASGASYRLIHAFAAQQLQAALTQSANGFTPSETPFFLAGL